MSVKCELVRATTMGLLLLTLGSAVFAFSACDGDNGDGDATATSAPAATATAPPPSTPTAETTPADGEPAIVIEEPELGAILQVPFVVSGTANVFEAALSVQVFDDSGVLVCQHNIMATAGTGTRGDWETTMAFPPPSAPGGQTAAPMTIRALSYSARDGSEENVVTVNVNVSSELPRIVIEEPPCGASFAAGEPIQASGTANVFEGALLLEIVDAAGNVVATQTAQAASGVEQSPWSASITPPTTLDPGTYWLVGYSESAQDGSREFEFPVPINITAQ